MRICDVENRDAIVKEIHDTWGFDVVDLDCGCIDSPILAIPDEIRSWLDTAKSIGMHVDSVFWGFPTLGDDCVYDSVLKISLFDGGYGLTLRKYLEPSDENTARTVANRLFGKEPEIDSCGNVDLEYTDRHYSLSLGGILGEELVVDYVGDTTVTSDDFIATYDTFKSL